MNGTNGAREIDLRSWSIVSQDGRWFLGDATEAMGVCDIAPVYDFFRKSGVAGDPRQPGKIQIQREVDVMPVFLYGGQSSVRLRGSYIILPLTDWYDSDIAELRRKVEVAEEIRNALKAQGGGVTLRGSLVGLPPPPGGR